ncbi:MAG: hypothetical protein CFE23_08265 [Flavobacterium sp. BFFFF1]|uniref:hypothetical protein n=1 Tax=Flavobacterium sp. BFFFF1 TaxID=2015557 RepID=UPI000BCC16A7|nr:hypothetical protein [Flavobacterium sp. BFFFF1]OYU80704.1 MAG: hypothetical protein CFE23_08265 [Flavobacterium sp. BFFFF1]
MRICLLLFSVLIAQLAICQNGNSGDTTLHTSPFLTDSSISALAKKAYLNQLTADDFYDVQPLYREAKSLVAVTLEPLTVERVQFNLRAFLNICKSAPSTRKDYFGTEQYYRLARYIENHAVAVAAAFATPGYLDKEDMKTIAAMTVQGLILYRRGYDMNLKIGTFMERINAYVKGSSDANKKAITQFSQYLKKAPAIKESDFVADDNPWETFDLDWLKHMELNKRFKNVPRLKDLKYEEGSEFTENGGGSGDRMIERSIGDTTMYYYFSSKSETAYRVNMNVRGRDLIPGTEDKYRIDCEGNVEYFPDGKLKQFTLQGSTVISDSLEVNYLDFISIDRTAKGNPVDHSCNDFKQDTKAIVYIAKEIFPKPPVAIQGSKSRYIIINPVIAKGRKYWVVTYYWNQDVIKYLAVDDDTLEKYEIPKEVFFKYRNWQDNEFYKMSHNSNL